MISEPSVILTDASGNQIPLPGVTLIRHEATLKVETDADATQSTRLVNNAQNEPDMLTLEMTFSDADPACRETDGNALLQILRGLKEKRGLLRVNTPLQSCARMLLTGLAVNRDEHCQSGWTAELTFQQSLAADKKSKKKKDNASGETGSGRTSAPASRPVSDLSGLPEI